MLCYCYGLHFIHFHLIHYLYIAKQWRLNFTHTHIDTYFETDRSKSDSSHFMPTLHIFFFCQHIQYIQLWLTPCLAIWCYIILYKGAHVAWTRMTTGKMTKEQNRSEKKRKQKQQMEIKGRISLKNSRTVVCAIGMKDIHIVTIHIYKLYIYMYKYKWKKVFYYIYRKTHKQIHCIMYIVWNEENNKKKHIILIVLNLNRLQKRQIWWWFRYY